MNLRTLNLPDDDDAFTSKIVNELYELFDGGKIQKHQAFSIL